MVKAPLSSPDRLFNNQIAGRSKFFDAVGGHVLKATVLSEVNAYLTMLPSIIAVAPKCCAVILDGKIQLVRPCNACKYLPSDILAAGIVACDKPRLLLNDVTRGMVHPRLLDVKLGTRTYGDNATPEKLIRHLLKCETSTSMKLGCRLTGGRYDSNGTQVQISRARGKTYTENEFRSILTEFVDIEDEKKIKLVRQLEAMQQAIKSGDRRRYVGCSAFFAIDDHGHAATVKLIDFAKRCDSAPHMPQYHGFDEGVVLGIQTLIDIIMESM